MMGTTVEILLALVLCVTFAFAFPSNFEEVNEIRNVVSVAESESQKIIKDALAGKFATSGRIVGGNIAPVNAYPYHVGIVANFGKWFGGTLISDQYVLTAAHCVEEVMYVILYLGVNNIRDYDQLDINYLVNFQDIRMHPEWWPPTYRNDIAVIPLPQKVPLSNRIQPLPLPTRSDDFLDFEQASVIATGWGYTDDNSTEITAVLQYANIPLEPFNICRHFYPFMFTELMICASSRFTPKLCISDDGGPLVYTRKDGSRFLAGIVAFTSPLECSSLWPAMNTRVPKYLDWISEVTGIAVRN